MNANTDWFRDIKWGVMVHFLASPPSSPGSPLASEQWNEQVESANVEALADQIAEARAGYLLMSLGQNSGHYCSPNTAYDEITGVAPSRCSRRDLIAETADALGRRGIAMLAYLPSHPPYGDQVARKAFEYFPWWHKGYDGPVPEDKRLTACQRRWEAVIREWSLRWGGKVRGWWIDGVYRRELYDSPEEPNFKSFTAAMKAGNADSIVALNPGIQWPITTVTEHQDYTAGEVDGQFFAGHWPDGKWTHPGRFLDGAQLHILSFLGQFWNKPPKRFPVEFPVGYTKFINSREGVVTWDVPITRDCRILPEFMEQLKSIGEAVAAG